MTQIKHPLTGILRPPGAVNRRGGILPTVMAILLNASHLPVWSSKNGTIRFSKLLFCQDLGKTWSNVKIAKKTASFFIVWLRYTHKAHENCVLRTEKRRCLIKSQRVTLRRHREDLRFLSRICWARIAQSLLLVLSYTPEMAKDTEKPCTRQCITMKCVMKSLTHTPRWKRVEKAHPRPGTEGTPRLSEL